MGNKIKILISYLFLSLCITSCQSHQTYNSSIVKIEMYDEAANLLMMIGDEGNGLIDSCKITPAEALRLTMPLRALIDEEVHKNNFYISIDQEMNCVQSCHCGIYSDLSKEKKTKENLYKKAANMSKISLVACANKTAKWFCSSTLFKILKFEITKDSSNAL